MQRLEINKARKILFVFFTVFWFATSEGQQIFQKTYEYNSTGQSGKTIISDTSGDLFLISSIVGVGAGGMDALVKRTDSIGNIKWAKVYGTSGTNTPFKAILTTAGEIMIICKSVRIAGMWNRDILVIKLDVNGNLIWWKSFGNINGDLGGIELKEVTGGDFIILGAYSFTDSTSSEILNRPIIIKIDSDGNIKWSKFYYGFQSFGFTSLQTDMDSGFIVTGGLKEYEWSEYDLIIAKFDSSGNFIWGNRYDGGNFEFGRIVFKSSPNEFIAGGETKSYPPGQHSLLINIDGQGQTLWTKIMSGLSDVLDIQHTVDSNFIIGGFGASLIKTDNNFNIIWQGRFGGFIGPNFKSVISKPDGGYIGYGSSNFKMFMVQTDSTGYGCQASTSNITINTVSPTTTSFTLTDSTYSFDVDTTVVISNVNLLTTTICFTGTEINENMSKKNNYSIYPNPVWDKIIIKSLNNETRIEITDILGRTEIYLNKDTRDELKIDVSKFNDGILFIKIFDNKGDYQVEKIVKL